MAALSGCDGVVIITREVAYGVYVDVGLSLHDQMFFVLQLRQSSVGLTACDEPSFCRTRGMHPTCEVGFALMVRNCGHRWVLCISVFVALEQIFGKSFSLLLFSRSLDKMSCQFVGLLSNLVVSSIV